MKKYTFIIFCFFTFSCQNTNSKSQTMDNFTRLSKETAHPNAKKILAEDFYWSEADEFSPFGNDDGFDAFYGFKEWRKTNLNISPLKYIEQLIQSWGMPKFDLYSLDTSKIKTYLNQDTKVDGMEDQMPALREQMKKMAEDAGKKFDEEEFNQIMKMSSSGMGSRYLLGQDNAIIATGFGQFILEGRIDDDIKALTKISLQRQLLPILLDRWDDSNKVYRAEVLNNMLKKLEQMNK